MKAYAKVNLTLDICGRRADGYHLLQSIMQRISLADELTLEPAERGITIRCDDPSVPTDEHNIIYKVAKAFFAHAGITDKGIRFTLEKHIPSGAGLGGGSSDGVTALRLLDRYFETHWNDVEMAALVAPIGADLPFFVYGGAALVEGVGEKVTPLPPFQKGALVLIKPALSLSTPTIYHKYDTVSKPFHPDTEAALAALQAGDPAALGRAMGNSLEPAAAADHPIITELKHELLKAGALGAMMTGSGSAVFGLFESEEAARRAKIRDGVICKFV